MLGPFVSAVLDVRSSLLRSIVSVLGVVVAISAVLVVDATTTASRAATRAYLEREFGIPATLEVPATSKMQADQVYAALADGGVENRTLVQNEQFLILRGDLTYRATGQLTLEKSGAVRSEEIITGTTPEIANVNLATVSLDEASLSALGLTAANAVGSSVELAYLGSSSQFDVLRRKARPAVVAAVHRTAPDGGPLTFVLGGSSDQRSTFSVEARVSEDDVDLVSQIVRTVGPDLSTNRLDRASQLAPIQAQERRVGQALSLLALVIGGLGLLTTRMSVVRERKSELGIRRAIGATRGAIVLSVTTEAFIITCVAGVIALGLASVIFAILPPDLLTQGSGAITQLTLPTSSIVVGMVGAAVIGLIGGLIPAALASRTSIVDAVRR
jgi:putative ABC transport system permease protein